jgi:hypothetical protein
MSKSRESESQLKDTVQGRRESNKKTKDNKTYMYISLYLKSGNAARASESESESEGGSASSISEDSTSLVASVRWGDEVGVCVCGGGGFLK